MKMDSVIEQLMRAARNNPPTDRVPYAFEKRIMARLKDTQPIDLTTWIASQLWRAVVPCFAVMILLGAWFNLGTIPGQDTNLAEGSVELSLDHVVQVASVISSD